MKRLLSITLAVILALGLGVMPLPVQPAMASPGTINVPGSDNTTIQEAIIAASSGDTVLVAAGTYYEHITLKSGVVVQGAGAETIIDGGGSGSVVTGADNSTISGFTITNGANGIYNHSYSSPTITNNIITNTNIGIYNFKSNATIINNTIAGNTDGIRTWGSPVPTIANNIIAYNSGRGIRNTGSSAQGKSALTTSYNDIFGNNPNYEQAGYASHTVDNDIVSPPQFVDPANGDYHLQAGSPCIDAGNTAAVPSWLTVDFEGDSRIVDGDGDGDATVDMGADEFVSSGNTPEGTDITVSFPDEGAQVTFSEVTTSGETSMSANETGPEIPSGFMLAGVYYDITTNAGYSGDITVCISYDEGSLSVPEENLRMYHFDGDNWEDVTISLDTGANIICGEATDLSIFAVIAPLTLSMSGFEIEHAKIDFKKKPDDGKIRVKGKLGLDLDNGDGVAISENVTVTVGPLSEIILMSEKGKKGEKWEYKRPKHGEGNIKRMTINWKNGKFDIRMDKVDLSGVTNPVTISIQIGDDLGKETIQMREKKHHWDYKYHHKDDDDDDDDDDD